MKAKEKRKPRAYKITDSAYQKAMRMAKKEKESLATLVEAYVTSYGNGAILYNYHPPKTSES